MFSNFLKIAFRNFLRSKFHSLINIIGLSLGLAAVTMILIFILMELSYDKFHVHGDGIYRIAQATQTEGNREQRSALTPGILAPELISEIPEVSNSVRIYKAYESMLVKHGNNVFFEDKIFWIDPAFFNLFSFELIAGNPQQALALPNSVVLTESAAYKYFGNETAINETIIIEGNAYKITGIAKDVPYNSHFHFDFIISFSTIDKGDYVKIQGSSFYTYILLNELSDYDAAEEKIVKASNRILGEYFADRNVTGFKAQAFLQHLHDIHLYSDLKYELEANGSIRNVYITLLLSLVITLIACINYVNLSTSKFETRAKEIGLRKVLGAGRKNLVKQFLVESIAVSFVSLLISVGFVVILTGRFYQTLGREFSFSSLQNLELLFVVVIVLTFLIGLLSGLYPAFFLSKFQPSQILKGGISAGRNTFLFRRALVVLQFATAVSVISIILVMNSQIGYMKNKDLGFKKDKVIVLTNLTDKLVGARDQIINEFLKSPEVANITYSQHIPGKTLSSQKAYVKGADPESAVIIHEIRATYDYAGTYGMEIIKGRDFSKDVTSDKHEAVILNETALESLGLESPIGTRLEIPYSKKSLVIGVVKDFHFESLYEEVKPVFLHLQFKRPMYISIRTNHANIKDALVFLEDEIQVFDADYPFDYYIIEDAFNNMYAEEENMLSIYSYSALLALIISVLGLFALSSFTVMKRTKEIGIRKVMGSSVSNVLWLLLKDFSIWVVISNLIAFPLAYLIMNNWLQNFAYRIEISLIPFTVSGAIALIIAVVTVSYHAVQAALLNPTETMKYE